jgi:kynurenine formamidase
MMVDLTQFFETGMPVYPGIAPPSFTELAVVASDGYAMTEHRLWNHTGTHIDAPAHQILGGATLDEFGLDRLVAPAAVVDLSGRPPGPIGWAELEPLARHVTAGDWVLVYSDNGRNWGSDAYWSDWSYPDADAARALIDLGISGVGFDGPSPDPVDSTELPLHRIWLGAGRLILENLTNLDLLPPRVDLVVAPMKVRGANGGPTRVFALS